MCDRICVISFLYRLMSASNICVQREWGKSKWETERERCTGSTKTTLSKEGFKDYQLRLLGNLRSCILSTSKSRCMLECCKWESVGWDGGGDEEGRREGESDFSNKCWHRACLILEFRKQFDLLSPLKLSGCPSERQAGCNHTQSRQPVVWQLSSYSDDH